MHRRNIYAAALVLAALLPAAALAELPKVVVVPYAAAEGATEQMAQRFTQTLQEQLKTRTDLAVATAPSSSPRGKAEAAAKAPKASPDAAPTLDAGRKAFADLKFDEAFEKLKKGIELSLADPATADYPKILGAQLELAVAAFRLGEEREAAAALLTLARWAPQTDVSAYPPVFIREWEKAKKKAEKQGKHLLTVDGPPGATAFVDGTDLGMVPVEEQVVAGTHHVKLEGPKGERWGQAVEVKGAPVKVKGVFSGQVDKPGAAPSEPRLGATLDAKAAEKLAAWCGAAGADFALVGVVWRSSETELSVASAVYWTRKEGFAPLAVATFPEGSYGAEEATKVLDKLAARVEMFGPTLPLPHALVPKGAAKPPADDYAVATVKDRPTPKPSPDAAKPRLVPDDTEDEKQVPIDEPPPEVSAGGGSGAVKWVILAVGVAAAAGAGIGTYFIVSNATKPVTGTVSATW